jgi:threonine dehydrogenase-like Zn-dependent dehydrogenase
MKKINAIWFTAPRKLEVRPENLPAPAPGEVEIATLYSAISPGTEMLVYRGQFPQGMATDSEITSLEGEMSYPLQYGYAAVGRAPDGKHYFSFQPHQSAFCAAPENLIAVPGRITPEQAVFLPNMETAVNFVMDGRPMIGERVAVLGQGIVGLLTTNLLAMHPLKQLVAIDHYPNRRDAAKQSGAHLTLSPDDDELEELAQQFDLVYELSGNPAALDLAITLCGFGGRIVVGSWYGEKRAPVDLGGVFHRNRIQLISSQVSTIAPELTGRWDKARRFEVAWEMIRLIQPERFITHRYLLDEAPAAYALLDQSPGDAIQVVFEYQKV